MKPVAVMVAVSVGFWLAATALLGRRTGVEVFFGMIGPLAATSSTWVVAARTFKRDPERLTALMITVFGGKMVFFAAYVAIMLTVLSLRPIPFMVSFTGYFIALYLIEALCLRRLFAGGTI